MAAAGEPAPAASQPGPAPADHATTRNSPNRRVDNSADRRAEPEAIMTAADAPAASQTKPGAPMTEVNGTSELITHFHDA